MKKNIDSIDFPREIALKTLYDIDVNKAYSNISIKRNIDNNLLKTIDKAFIKHLVYGVITNKKRIDWIISKFSKTPIEKMSSWVLNILRMGIYQILYLDKVPPSAAVNESVKLGKKYGHKKISGFINAILRNIIRAPMESLQPTRENEIDFLSIYYSHPQWMVKMWIREFGLDFTIDLLKSNNKIPPITIRTNTLKITRQELMILLEDEGMVVKKGLWCPEAIEIDRFSNIEESRSFQKGFFLIQDQSSMLVAHVLNPRQGQTILDLCAAPGGKTTHISELMGNTGKVIARDIHEHKLEIINQNMNRLGISNIQLELFNALDLDESSIEKADAVLIDAPCSGLGIIRRKPDLKWNKSTNDLKSITSLQLKILANAAYYVKKGGHLIYSTCTINPSENIELVKRFLNENTHFTLVAIEEISDQLLHHNEIKKGYLQVFPNTDKIDGFFISKLKRIS